MPHPLLLVADSDQDDRFFVRRAMTRLGLLNPFEEVQTGEEVQDYFKRKGRFANRTGYLQAVILLLDVHLPAISGVDVLRWARRDHPPELIGALLWTASSSPGENSFLHVTWSRAHVVKTRTSLRDDNRSAMYLAWSSAPPLISAP